MRKQLFCILMSAGVIYADSTWTGGGSDAKWSTTANWSEAQAPAGGILTFGGSTRLTNTNDLTDLSVSGIRFLSGAGLFSLRGNPLSIAGLIENSGTSSPTVATPLSLTGNLLLSVPNGGNLYLTNAISGVGDIYRSGAAASGTVGLYGTNTFTGNIYHSNNVFLVGNSQALGNPANVFYQLTKDASRLVLDNNVTISNKLVMYGSINTSALLSQNAKTNTLAGTLVTTNQFRIAVSGNGVLDIKGGVEALGTGSELFVLNASGGEIRFSEKPLLLNNRKFYADSGNSSIAVAGNQWGNLLYAGGTLRLDVPNCFPSDKAVILGVGYSQSGTIDLNGNNQIFGGLYSGNTATSGVRRVKSDVPAVLTVNQVADGGATAYFGDFAGALEIVKLGASRDFEITGTNCTHTGPVTVGQGAMAVKLISAVGVGKGGFEAKQLMISNNATFRLGAYTGVDALQILPSTHGVWLPSGSGTIDVGAARELQVESPIGGSGTLRKAGAGILRLKGEFAASDISIAAGTLFSDLTLTQSVAVASGAAFGVQPTTSPVSTLSLIPAAAVFSSGSRIALDASQAPGQFLQIDGVFADQGGGSVGLSKVNQGTVLLTGDSTFTGDVSIEGGTLSVSKYPVYDEASPLGVSSTNVNTKLLLAGGTLEYSGTESVSTYRRFSVSNSSNTTPICVKNAGATLEFMAYDFCNRGDVLIKTGPGTLKLDRISSASDNNRAMAAIYLLEGTLESHAIYAQRIQQNVSRLEASGPTLVFGDGALLKYNTPLQDMTQGGRQLIKYVGTQTRAIIRTGANLTFCGPNGEPGNTFTFDINDGADDTDLLFDSGIDFYTANTNGTYNNFLKTGAGTFEHTRNNAMLGTTTLRAGRILVRSNIPAGGVDSPIGKSTNTYGVIFGDAGTVTADRPALIYNGTASSFSYVRGTYIYTNTYAQIGSVSNIAVTINANFKNEGILGFCSYTMSDAFAVNCAVDGTGGLAKTGPGVVNLNVANGYTGRTIVEAGTLKVNADGAIPNGRNLVLNGGYLNLNGRTVSFGTLTVGGTATIDAAKGLVFSNSSAIPWSGKLTFANRTQSKVYFGSSASGLTPEQVALIEVPAGCSSVKMGTDGELIFVPSATVIILR